MRIAIIGLGGVGGYYAGRLAQRYASSGEHEVVFVARGKTLQAIKEAGLKVIANDGEFVCQPTLASDSPSEIGKADFVLFCTKSYGLEASVVSYRGIFGKDTVTVSLLNGVDNANRIRKALGGEGAVLNGLVYINASIVEPAVIKQAGPVSQLIFGTDKTEIKPEYIAAHNVMVGAGIDSHLTDEVETEVWIKYLFICPLAGITTLRKKSLGEILASEQDVKMLAGMIAEVKAVADKKGVALPADIVEATLKRVGDYPPAARTSMQKDFEAGRPTELDIFTGYISRTAQELGISTPLHNEVYEALKKYK